MRIAVLALQGAFIEHEHALNDVGAECFEIRELSDLKKDFDGLVLPGGESTVQGKLLNDLGLMKPLYERIKAGMPVLATCAGLILLASELENDSARYFGTLPVTVRRNAYGRQLGSFSTVDNYDGIGRIPMTFIRAPVIVGVSPEVKVCAKVDDRIVGVEYQNQIALAFHPELDQDRSIHKRFVSLV
ncbi:MAG: pyridoxal 5'-phosphate synthase glutaminase subunit PdxT [Succinatimonas hippei]|nr:pyridoxal 5'-phosphate synthase glutaminase subunit PdxT [Succinatimonas hippei]